uniref:Methyltransferase domain-containing protein n=1 Tax=Amphora coffeiformis TaxID=265554 RepID=A0A7S3P6B6_9STRA|eukprot:scaffold2753_cov154-Amphora_coffeaeformis.AAC.6
MELKKESYDGLPVTTELELMRQFLSTEKGAIWIELGCGQARNALALAQDFPEIQINAYEVDEKQHEKNVSLEARPKNISFGKFGMQEFPGDPESVDAIIMLKSLHHVPKDCLKEGFAKIKTALKPGGKLFINEPVFGGAFNEIMRLFHDEEDVRSHAFDVLQGQIEEGEFVLEKELHFQSKTKFPRGFADFEERILGSTFNHFHVTEDVLQTVKERFQQYLKDDGSAEFFTPMRTDILVKQAAN